jgi:alginate O-acetyltransferase complex protein AlgI
MAIGLSWMFNIRLPFNFDSPYKAFSISEFWRRWHISLSTFLRDYLYVPLGGNRKRPVRRYINLGLTMLLGGLWHGASWSFVISGALHGAYLMLNHAFRALAERAGCVAVLHRSRVFLACSWALTFVAVVFAWVFFRAETLAGAWRLVQVMLGNVSAEVDAGMLLWNAGLQPAVAFGWCAVLGFVAVFLPNSNRLGEGLIGRLHRIPHAASIVGGVALSTVVGLVVLNTARDAVSAFIYFNF